MELRQNAGILLLGYVPYLGATTTLNLGSQNFITTGTLSAGAITGTSLTDGTATLDDGSLTSAVNGTFSGTVQAEHLYTTDDLQVGDDILLGSGSVINWNSGDITLTHSANTLTFSGMTTLNFGSSALSSVGSILVTGAIGGSSLSLSAVTGYQIRLTEFTGGVAPLYYTYLNSANLAAADATITLPSTTCTLAGTTVAKSGTGVSSFRSRAVLLGGTGNIATPSTNPIQSLDPDNTANKFLKTGGGSTNPLWSTLTFSDLAPTATLSVATISSAGNVTYLSNGSEGSFLRSTGTNGSVGFSTLILPNSATANRIVYATATNTWGDSANLTFDGTDLTVSDTVNADDYTFDKGAVENTEYPMIVENSTTTGIYYKWQEGYEGEKIYTWYFRNDSEHGDIGVITPMIIYMDAWGAYQDTGVDINGWLDVSGAITASSITANSYNFGTTAYISLTAPSNEHCGFTAIVTGGDSKYSFLQLDRNSGTYDTTWVMRLKGYSADYFITNDYGGYTTDRLTLTNDGNARIRGIVTGDEKVTNGTFTGSAASWTLGSGWIYSINKAYKNANGTGTLSQAGGAMVSAPEVGKWYYYQFNVGAQSAGSIVATVGGWTSETITELLPYSYSLHSYIFLATSTDGIVFTPSNDFRGTIDDVVLKEVTNGGLDVQGIIQANGAIYLTQTDGNEYIDSLADGYVDIGATTGIRLNSPITSLGTTNKLQFYDSAVYAWSSADGWLNLVADVGVEVNAPILNVADLYVAGDFDFGSASTDVMTMTGRLVVRTAASDPQDATPANRPAGTVGEILYYSGKWYGCTNSATPTYEKFTSS